MKKNQLVLRCRKCEHLLFVDKVSLTRLKGIMDMDCPSCGEEGEENWILSRLGNYEDEYGNKE